MLGKNFQRPLDVWFHNLEAILDANVEAEKDWVMSLSDRIYPGDWIWLFTSTKSMYLAFCTPSDPNEEFILTEKSFGIHEGPVSFSTDRITGKSTMTSYTEYHNTAVISPRLMILLRSNMMPDPVEDKDEETRREKAVCINSNSESHVDPEYAGSLLEDLPVTKAKSSKSRDGGSLFCGDGDNGSDKFHFNLFRLNSRHIQMLNSIMLDQGCYTSLIVFSTKAALRKALEFYLDMPSRMHGMHSMKTISDLPDDPMKLLLEKLEHIAHELGSNVKARYHIDPLWEDDPRDRRKWLNVTRQDCFTTEHENPKEDESSSVEHIVLQLLGQTPSVVREPIEFSMEFLMRMVAQFGLSFEALYALDLLKNGSNKLEIPMERLDNVLEKEPEVFDFPHMVFRDIQRVFQRWIHSSQNISSIPLHVWRLSWYTLCTHPFEGSGRTVASVVQAMRRICEDSDDLEIRQLYGSSLVPEPQSLQKSQSKIVELPDATNSATKVSKEETRGTNAQKIPEYSRSGLSRAFDQIGQTLAEEQSSAQGTRRRLSRTGPDPILREQHHPISIQPKRRDFSEILMRPEYADMPEKRLSDKSWENYRTNASSKPTPSPRANLNHESTQSIWAPILIVLLVTLLLLLGSIQLIRFVLSFIDFVFDLVRSGFSRIHV